MAIPVSYEQTERKLPSLDGLVAPHVPSYSPASIDGMPLADIRDYMTGMAPDPSIEAAILSAIVGCRRDTSAEEPLCNIREVLDSIRALPRGDDRLRCMNTFVRTLGRRELLATLLDHMRMTARRNGTREKEQVSASLNSIKHAVYGWCGQTKIMRSSTDRSASITPPEPGVQSLLGKTPAGAWSLSLHIWQVNPKAKGFMAGNSGAKTTVREPPHTHPFDFMSMIVVGPLHQSVYAQRTRSAPVRSAITDAGGRYDNTELRHVHGVWPPHGATAASQIITVEDRVLFEEGNSYYLPCSVIHDVEVDKGISATKPAISLFLRSESVVKPHVYMAPEMALFHEGHPDLEHSGSALAEEDWHTKLKLVADYLRGKSSQLYLDDVVKYEGDYAFFHVDSHK